MTILEENEYHLLAEKRENGTMTNKEYKEWIKLIDKSFLEGLSKIAAAWKEGFGL